MHRSRNASLCFALSGLAFVFTPFPRAMHWAEFFRPFRQLRSAIGLDVPDAIRKQELEFRL
jgi:hypothetical protein